MIQTMGALTVVRSRVQRRLEAALDDVVSGSDGGGWLVSGEMGIGKTTTVAHLCRQARDRAVTVVRGRAVVNDDEPYRAIREALTGLFRQVPSVHNGPLGPYRTILADLLPTPAADDDPRAPPPRLVVAEAIIRACDLGSRADGLLLVLEDLHHADADTRAITTYLLDHTQRTRCMVVATTRPGGGATGMLEAARASDATTDLVLDRLSPADSRRLLDDAVPLGDDTARAVLDRAAGLPFALVELARHAATGADLRGVPESIADLVAGTMTHLPDDVRTLLRALSVADATDLAVLRRSGAWAPERADDLVRQARDARLLAADDPIRFRHDLIRDAVLARLGPETRRALAGTMLEGLDPQGPQCRTAAHLAAVCGRDDLVLTARLAAADLEVAAGRLASAEEQLQLAVPPAGTGVPVELQQRLVRIRARRGDLAGAEAAAEDLLATVPDAARATIHLSLGHAAFAAYRPDRIAVHLAAVDDLTAELDPAGRAAHVLLGAEHATMTRRADAVSVAQTAFEAYDSLGDATGKATARLVTALALESVDAQAADDAAAQARGLAQQGGAPHIAVAARAQIAARRFWRTGDIDQLRAVGEEATALGALATRVRIDLSLAGHAAVRFDTAGMRAATASARAAASESGLEALLGVITCMHAAAEDIDGDLEEADRLWTVALRADPGMAAHIATTSAQGATVREEPSTVRAHLEAAAALMAGRPSSPGPWRGSLMLLRAYDGESDLDAGIALGGWETLDRAAAMLAKAVVAGRAGDHATAEQLVAAATATYEGWPGSGTMQQISMRYVAEAAMRDGWGHPARWLTAVVAWCDQPPTQAVAASGRGLLRQLGAVAPLPATDVERDLRMRGLTSRERQVLSLIAAGATSREVGAQLVISPRTVDKHVERLRQKLSVSSRKDLVGAIGPDGLESSAGPWTDTTRLELR